MLFREYLGMKESIQNLKHDLQKHAYLGSKNTDGYKELW